MTAPAEELRGRLRPDLLVAMRERRGAETRVLRALLAALDNAEAVPLADRPASLQHRFGESSVEAARRQLSATEVQDLLSREHAARLEAAAELARLARIAESVAMRAEADLVSRYLS